MIIPIQVNTQGEVAAGNPAEVETLSLKDINVSEGALEEYVRTNIDKLFPDESLLIVGQRVRNQQAGRSDLVALDGDGNIVLIELKRDATASTTRKEPFEFQAIRYAANYALIRTESELEQKLFASYIEKHKNEPEYHNMAGLTSAQIATQLLQSFLAANQAVTGFNRRQRIVLIASGFDRQTLSACAWLVRNGIDIRCIELSPIRYNQQTFFEKEQLIPPQQLEEFLVEVATPSQGTTRVSVSAVRGSRQSLPLMPQIISWGLIAPGDTLFIRIKPSEAAEVVDAKYVKYQGQVLTYTAWLKQHLSWSGINMYAETVDKKSGKTLDKLRREKLNELAPSISADDLSDDSDTGDATTQGPVD